MVIQRLVVVLMLITVSSLVEGATTTADFLKMGGGSRASAMGESFVSIADDASTIYWNPAGLVNLKSPELTTMYNQFVVDNKYMFCGFGLPINEGLAIGAVMNYFGNPNMEIFGDDGSVVQTVTPNDLAIGIGVAKQVTIINYKFSVGLVSKFVSSTLTKSAIAFAGDLGILCPLSSDFNAGLEIRNFGTKMKWNVAEQNLPAMVSGGISYKKDISENNVLRIISEAKYTGEKIIKIGIGGEYTFFDKIAVRGGYIFNDSEKSFTVGAGINYQGIRLDFAYVPYKTLGHTFSVSVGYAFGKS